MGHVEHAAPESPLAGKYLTFRLGEEHYGIGILKVQEIIGMMNVTRVPRMPEAVRGVVNLRGRVIPVVDLRVKFGCADATDGERNCIIVMQVALGERAATMGAIVDEVSEVADIGADNIEPTPSFGESVDTSFIRGMGRVGEHVVMLLDIDSALSAEESEMLDQAGSAA